MASRCWARAPRCARPLARRGDLGHARRPAGRALAEWMVDGAPRSTSASSTPTLRARAPATPTCGGAARSSTARSTTSSIRRQQIEQPAACGRQPFFARQQELGASLLRGRRLGAAAWYARQRPRCSTDRAAVASTTSGRRATGRRSSGAEHLAAASARPASSISRRSPSCEVSGPRRAGLPPAAGGQRSSTGPSGAIVYTTLLNERGGITSRPDDHAAGGDALPGRRRRAERAATISPDAQQPVRLPTARCGSRD